MSRGMLLWESILAGLQVIAGAGALLAWLDPRVLGLVVVVVAAMQVATMTYKRGLGTPVPDPALQSPADVVARYVAPQVNRD